MRTPFVILGVLALLVGVVWILQGVNVITGSAMSGSNFWLAAGVVVALVGAGILGFGVRSSPARKPA